MKHTYILLLFLALGFGAFSQVCPPLLPDKEIIAEAKEKGIPESELKGYVAARKAQQLQGSTDKTAAGTVKRTSKKRIAPGCNNPDFEAGSFTGWNGSTGRHPYAGSGNCCPAQGFMPGKRHTIMSGNGTDPLVNIPIVAPGGGSYSVRLGNSNKSAEAERLEYTFVPSANNSQFAYQYAVVLEKAGHGHHDDCFFAVEAFDGNGNIIACSADTIRPSSPGLRSTANSDIVYKPWSSRTIDLFEQIGQTVTIRFTTADCAYGGHFGYAYIDGSCAATAAPVVICSGSEKLTAPAGAASYQWSTGATTQSIEVTQPGSYSVVSAFGAGCPVTNYFSVTKGTSATSSFTVASSGANLGFTNTSTGNNPVYAWNFGDGSKISNEMHPSHTYLLEGNYNVCLTVTDASGCATTTCQQVTIESTDIAPQSFNDMVSIYPNPSTSGIVTVDVAKLARKDVKIIVYNIIGNAIYEREIISNSNIDKHVVDISSFPAGNYFLTIEADDALTTRRIYIK
jgi:PKD repeat protein